MIECNFYSTEEIRPMYDEIVPAYQSAFAGDPWYEVSKCADSQKRCVGGLSSLALGSMCTVCNEIPTELAYKASELTERFEAISATRSTVWYTERTEAGLALAAIAWEATAATIAKEKYANVNKMADWIQNQLGDEPIVWLDEVFANRNLRASGNLARFNAMNMGFMERLNNKTLAFRTINKRMINATKRDFPAKSQVFERDIAVPDRREFVVIKDN
jgi:hypothetical protein